MLAVSTELNKLVRIGNYLTPQSSQSLCSLTHSMYYSLATLDTIRLINVVSAAVGLLTMMAVVARRLSLIQILKLIRQATRPASRPWDKEGSERDQGPRSSHRIWWVSRKWKGVPHFIRDPNLLAFQGLSLL